MDKQTKISQSQVLHADIKDVSALVLVSCSGLTVAQSDLLRNNFRSAGCSYRVYKNSTVRYAIEGTGHEPLKPLLKGMIGVAYNADDPGAPARIVRDLNKENNNFELKGAVVDGQVLSQEDCEKLADMPGPREIKAKLLMLFKTPATRMVQVMQAPARDFLRVLTAKKTKDEEAA